MRIKKPHRASLDEVRITREGDDAIIEFADPTVSGVRFRLGHRVSQMTDAAILDRFNTMIEARDEVAAQFENKVVEIPVGKPQINYSEDADQWVPRGSVLRCHIEDDEQGELVVYVDDQKLDLRQFGRMLKTYAGWGMRIYFVDDDAIAEEPALEVREPEDQAL
jgi:hypothetical protein